MTGEHLRHLPFPVLTGDIGGTNARFSIIEDPQAEAHRFPTVHTADFATIDDAIQAAVLDQTALAPRTAILALAGPITEDRVELTNCHWVVEPKKSIARLGLSEMILLNDFEAQSLALPDLGPEDVAAIGGGTMQKNRPRVVLGPGTGLGAGALVHAGGTWIPVPGEGGHIDLGPVTSRDMAIWPHIERVDGRVSAEAVLSGPGLLRLYRAICAADGIAPALDTQEDVTRAGLSGEDSKAAEALEMFATCLGRFAGDLAMIFMAYGGVFLAGGIVGRIDTVIKGGAFRRAFEAKAPHDDILAGIGTAIVTRADPPLAGIAAFARAPARFGLELEGRRWRA